jgi:hypothetical protein
MHQLQDLAETQAGRLLCFLFLWNGEVPARADVWKLLPLKVKSLISVRLASNGLFVLLFLLVIFHVLILVQVIPHGMVWGGRIENESISILINVIMLLLVSVQRGLIRVKINKAIILAGLWAMFVLFALNTLGNAMSLNETERWFAPVTLLLAIFSLRLALDK